jgi:23S rRNA G2445 N2-methylase RlmL
MWQDEVHIFRDVSGESLHRRGFRGVIHKFALNEAAAAGILYVAGWPEIAEAGGKLVDPMCGSGTILVEAALMAHRVAPGLFRKEWAHMSWPDFDKRAWREALDAARGSIARKWSGVIAGNDIDEVQSA